MKPTQSRTGASSTGHTDEGRLAIDAENVHVTYDDGTEAVRGVDLRIPPGECFAFLGPNGAGKTTTIKTLVTLLRPDRGSVAINGYDIADEPRAVRESIGYMAQTPGIDEELTARENVRFACDVYGVAPSERVDRIDSLLELVGLEGVADDRAETFSGGMKKRLDAATALVHQPPVVFLDEPTTGLDPAARTRLWDHVESLNDRGTTVFLTTQYLAEADRLCDRLAVIRDGEIIATDTPDRLAAAVGGDVLELALADSSTEEKTRALTVVRESDALDAARVELTENGITITADGVRGAAMELFVSLHKAGVAVTGFDVRSPTLDDVFLALTGDRSDSVDELETAAPTEKVTAPNAEVVE